MHILEGSKDEIEKQLKTSLRLFDIYPESEVQRSDGMKI